MPQENKKKERVKKMIKFGKGSEIPYSDSDPEFSVIDTYRASST